MLARHRPALSSRLASRRWFSRYEGSRAGSAEKVLLVVLGYAIGGLGYLVVNRLNATGTFHHLDLPIDHRIPFVPAFVFFYVLVYVSPALAAFSLTDRAELYRAFLAFGLNALVCFPIFLLFPVEYPRVEELPAGLAGRLLSLVHAIDRPVNCFPSHHIATAFTTFLSVHRQDSSRGAVFGVAALLVAASTLFVKQHYFLDVPAGIAVAWITFVLSFPPAARRRRRT